MKHLLAILAVVVFVGCSPWTPPKRTLLVTYFATQSTGKQMWGSSVIEVVISAPRTLNVDLSNMVKAKDTNITEIVITSIYEIPIK